jgi:peptide/nickel transport system permease protein
MAQLIALEAALAVIGFGVQPPQPSWGNILNGAQDIFTLQFKPWAWIPPAGLITLTILCINFIGDGLRDAFDPSFER